VTGRTEQLAAARSIAAGAFDPQRLLDHLAGEIAGYRFRPAYDGARMRRAAAVTVDVLGRLPGDRLTHRWEAFETAVWPQWVGGQDRPLLGDRWTWGVWALVTSRLVRPGWAVVGSVRIGQWVARLPADDPLITAHTRLAAAAAAEPLGSPAARDGAVTLGLRLLLARGLDDLSGLVETDLLLPGPVRGADVLDGLLCHLWVFDRTPRRGISRHRRTDRHAPTDLARVSGVPAAFTDVTGRYLQLYARRISDIYPTLRHKARALGHFFQYLQAEHPEVTCCAAITPAHARGFVPYAVTISGQRRRGRYAGNADQTTTAHAWLVDVRAFFADLCMWATEPGSPLAGHAPAAVPLSRHDLLDTGFVQARQRTAGRLTGTVLDLEREIPNIRAFALRRWHEADQHLTAHPGVPAAVAGERVAFWDWALLELLLTSGLRIEEACELTTFDVLKRTLPDGRLYYLLHIKPSKSGRARVIPIGDSLGRVIAEIVRHVRGYYSTSAVPACDRRDEHEKRPLPRAPYLLQGRTHPSTVNTNTIRGRLRALSLAAGGSARCRWPRAPATRRGPPWS